MTLRRSYFGRKCCVDAESVRGGSGSVKLIIGLFIDVKICVLLKNELPGHVRMKYQLDSEHFIMCVFVMRVSGNKVISNPELDVENRWYKILESRQTDLCSTSTIHVLVKYFG